MRGACTLATMDRAAMGCAFSVIMGYPDDITLRSSMTLFLLAAVSDSEFWEVIEKHFGGHVDPHSVDLLEVQS